MSATHDVPPGVNIKNGGVFLKRAQTINMASGISASDPGNDGTDLVASGGGSGITTQDNGTLVDPAASVVNFAGTGVKTTGGAGTSTVNIPGGKADVLANRPAMPDATKRGMLFYATDVPALYISDGSSWTTLSLQPLAANLTALAGLTSAAGTIPEFTGAGTAGLLNFDTDGTLAANSDSNIPSQKAVRTYVDNTHYHTVADAAYNIAASDRMVVYTSITAARTATLPPVASVTPGAVIEVLDGSGSLTPVTPVTITVAPQAGEKINGVTNGTFVIDQPYGAARFVADGGGWWHDTLTAVVVDTYTGNGTWYKRAGTQVVEVTCLGGGGGGGGGQAAAAAALRAGGGGGGGGFLTQITFRAADLGSTETVTIGGGGSAGAATAVGAAAPGGNGGNGGASSFGTTVRAQAAGGPFGNGGNAGTGNGAQPGKAAGTAPGGTGGSSNGAATGGAGDWTLTGSASYAPLSGGGGGAGGAVNGSNTQFGGGAGAGGTFAQGAITGGAGGAAGNNAGGSGATNNGFYGGPGGGGGGGSSSSSVNGGPGGTPVGFGGGGGGGGPTTSGGTSHSGAGAVGAPGLVVVISYMQRAV